MTTLTWDRHRGHAYTYDVVELGYNYRVDEIHSALGLAQLRKLKANNARRQVITRQYRLALCDSGIDLPFQHTIEESACHIFPILLPSDVDRTRFIDLMRQARIQTSIHYPPIHQFSYYARRYPGIQLPQTEDVARREVTLPLYPTMSDEAVAAVVSAVRHALNCVHVS
jgi:dTDP-4-amino-4,6-dideoxygalactose transaminase